MGKVFGYSKNGGKDWFKSNSYSDIEIEAIKDPEGGSEISLPTAIPSPFARIDLVKTAFKNISKTTDLIAYTSANGDIIASKADEKLVSDCLDLAEILFNIDNFDNKIRIIVWDKATELRNLKDSLNDKHKRFAETLELYLDQDQASYNFDLLTRLYLIEYDHKIIGCTSPVTLFFTTANDLSDASIRLTTNNYTFGEKYTPLYKRDSEFQKYLYLLFKANIILSQRLKAMADYLDKNLQILDKKNKTLYDQINNLNAENFITDYSELNTGTEGNLVEVIGVPLRKRKKDNIVSSVLASDFIIRSSKFNGNLIPLVLQNDLNKTFRYVVDKWDRNIKVPYYDDEPFLGKRRLPGLCVSYPYITVSDFLEPYLIRLVYPVNKDKFFDGNLEIRSGNDLKGYVLPLKPLFFDYFTTDDLVGSLPDKPRITMEQGIAGSVKVILNIPVVK